MTVCILIESANSSVFWQMARRGEMELIDYLKQALDLKEEPPLNLVEEEPAFTFTLEERGKGDE